MHRFCLSLNGLYSQLWSDSDSFPELWRCKNHSPESSTSLSAYLCYIFFAIWSPLLISRPWCAPVKSSYDYTVFHRHHTADVSVTHFKARKQSPNCPKIFFRYGTMIDGYDGIAHRQPRRTAGWTWSLYAWTTVYKKNHGGNFRPYEYNARSWSFQSHI